MDIRKARKRRGWSLYQAAKLMDKVGYQTLKNLEQREGLGLEVKVRTMLEVCRVYYPDVSLKDFCDQGPLPGRPRLEWDDL